MDLAAEASRLRVEDFARFVALNAPVGELFADAERGRAFERIVAQSEALLARGARAFARELPARIGDEMQRFGWLWNGFYVAGEDGHLHLAQAHGPPVCTPLERHGGPLSSGMCHDAIALNQTLAAFDVGGWPGYVSCDSSSGLGTVSGIVCPVRDPGGVPVAVWDLDATERIEPGDVRALDVLFASAARCVPFARSSFTAAP